MYTYRHSNNLNSSLSSYCWKVFIIYVRCMISLSCFCFIINFHLIMVFDFSFTEFAFLRIFQRYLLLKKQSESIAWRDQAGEQLISNKENTDASWTVSLVDLFKKWFWTVEKEEFVYLIVGQWEIQRMKFDAEVEECCLSRFWY